MTFDQYQAAANELGSNHFHLWLRSGEKINCTVQTLAWGNLVKVTTTNNAVMWVALESIEAVELVS